jgi:hypothetical protein
MKIVQSSRVINNENPKSRISYGNLKRKFDLSFSQVNYVPNVNDFAIVKSSVENANQYGTGVFYVDGFYDNQDYTSLVYYCTPPEDFSYTNDSLIYKSFNLTLEEM